MANKFESLVVDSTAIYSAEYDLSKNEMMVYFNNDSIYKYHDVPLFMWRGLFNSSSKGKFLNNFILKSFDYGRVN